MLLAFPAWGHGDAQWIADGGYVTKNGDRDMRWLLLSALLLAGCEGDTRREHCEAMALLTYAPKFWTGGFGRIRTEEICIVAIKPLER